MDTLLRFWKLPWKPHFGSDSNIKVSSPVASTSREQFPKSS